ncbi:MAG: Spy/CpxP family protein refolding chaperone [Flavisolibacter sp.]
MKKIFTATLAFVLFAGAAQAQTKDTTEHHRNGGHEMMVKELNLTADQQAKLKSIHEQERNEMKALKDKSLTADQLKAQRTELHKKYRTQTESVFTPAQKQQMEKMRSEWKAKGGHEKKARKDDQANRSQGEKGFKRGESFQKELNLTQDQKDKMARLRADSKTSFESIRKDQSLTDDQKKVKMHDLRKQQSEQMKSILTAEQLEKMNSFRKERAAKNTK